MEKRSSPPTLYVEASGISSLADDYVSGSGRSVDKA